MITFRGGESMNVYKKLFRYVPEMKGMAVLSAILATAASFLLVLPYRLLYDVLWNLAVRKDYGGAGRYAFFIVAAMVLQGILYFLALWCSHCLAFRTETNLRKKGLKHLMGASFTFFDLHSSGRIRKILDDNAADTHMALAHLIPDTVVGLTSPIFLLLIVFSVDYRLGILIGILTIIALVLMKAMVGNLEFMKSYMASLERMNAESVEYVRGMQVVKIFQSTLQSFTGFYEAIRDYSKNALEYTKTCRFPYILFQGIFQVSGIVILPVAIMLILRGGSPMEIMVKVLFFVCLAGTMFNCFMRIMYIGMYHCQADRSVSTLEDLFIDMEQKKMEYGTRERFEHSEIEFRNVTFRYDQETVLKDVSFRLPEGRSYALVGSSGGGKSTIAKLIAGMYRVDEGEIRIGGYPLKEYTQEALQQKVAFVFQHAQLFKTSIFDNVRTGRPEASREEVMNALERARCMEILDKFPERELTVIGAKGVHLSGGEKQRIAIARAILKDADIVILDEASAAADPENEYEIQQAFSDLMKGKTVIMIAHRLSSIREVDEILVVEHGHVMERGNHKELMEADGTYRRLQDLFARANEWRVSQ